MDSDGGMVLVSEVQEVVAHLRSLSARAADSRQQWLHFVLATGAESLADNLEAADSLGDNCDD